jgi:hypothetical protein
MPNPSGYEPVLSGRASSWLVGLSRPKQKQVLRLLFQLSKHPGQLGDYATREEDGREIQHLMVGDWHFSFWADHAVRELRIT